MKKIIPIALSLGCIGAGAATNNFDLLGRKGSAMNSPMVYKNVDYTKAQKDEQQKVSPSLEAHSLQKLGMPNSIKAIEGAFSTVRDHESKRYYFRKHTASSSDNCFAYNANFCTYSWNDYKNLSNQYFIPINEDRYFTPSYETAGWTNASGVTFYYPNYGNYMQNSPYVSGQTIQYKDFYTVLGDVGYSQADLVSNWFSSRASYVGVFMGNEALPVRLRNGIPVRYVRTNTSESFNPAPGYEMKASRTFRLVSGTSRYSIPYVGKDHPNNPAGQQPQVYMGVRNDRIARASSYSSLAKSLDNYIYQYRTLEFVPVGNYGSNGGQLNSMAHAANAIAVGGIDPSYMSTPAYSSYRAENQGFAKPEVKNFTHLYSKDDNYVEYARTYNYGNNTYSYQPFYDGTEVSAAYTAGMVSNLLATNPFYRWHPEVVKAMLLSTVTWYPTYDYLVFDNTSDQNRHYYDSRYWNGDITKLKTRTVNNQHEIWFVVHNLGWSSGRSVRAAISWLSSGNDIARAGKIPQNFDLYVYGSDNSSYSCLADPSIMLTNNPCGVNFNFSNPGTLVASSTSLVNAYEQVAISSPYSYLVFKIVLKSDDPTSENYGQVVLGLNISGRYGN
ncbi:MAG: hypothetical protein IK012_06170 [Fibrobacter sp.]|uniref:hypothetical protein n=1 Tax=Fibrobacter sp. TaxID=35828 RepID=UPI0025B9B394|nr:hypothetical protein [Fibrobacter sp.]MBR4784824.1 hypothetical protein [Fibrobacter sp.]